MRLLLLHVRGFTYKALDPAVRDPPDPPGSGSCSNCLLVFVSVETGDTYSTVKEACDEIASWAGKVGVSQVLVYPYAHLSRDLAGVEEAHNALRELSGCLESRGLEVHRAPLGWYKEFSLELQGHPLAEAFREIAGEPLTVRFGGESVGLRRAVERGVLDGRWLQERLGRGVSEVMERLCLGQNNNSRLAEYILKLEKWVARTLGPGDGGLAREVVYVTGIREPRSLLFLVKACSLALSREVPLAVEGCGAGDLVVAVESSMSPERLLEGLSGGISGRMVEISVGSGEPHLEVGRGVKGRLIGYMHEDGGISPLAMLLGRGGSSIACIGPLYSVLKAVFSNELLKASKGGVPAIPAWLHQYQAAVIPVSESEAGYARRVAEELVNRGASVLLLSNTGERLGSRIRYAAMRWIPYILVTGKREAETSTVSVRRRWRPGEQEVVTLESLLEELAKLLSGSPLLLPRLVQVSGGKDVC